MLSFFTLPDATSTMTSIGDYSSAIFDELLPVLYIVAGLIIGGLIVSKIISTVIKGASKVVGRGGRRRGRR